MAIDFGRKALSKLSGFLSSAKISRCGSPPPSQMLGGAHSRYSSSRHQSERLDTAARRWPCADGVGGLEEEFNQIEHAGDWPRVFAQLRSRSVPDAQGSTSVAGRTDVCVGESNSGSAGRSSTTVVVTPRFQAARKPDNRRLNRYTDVLPFDHSRVVLKRGDVDYINASRVHYGPASRTYILTQGPLEETVGHFWLMVWEQTVPIIVMLNRVIEKQRPKCHKYWPDEVGSVLELEDVELSVELLSEDENDESFVHRVFRLTDNCSGASREVSQFQYTEWPDFGIPTCPNDFLRFLELVRNSGLLTNSDGIHSGMQDRDSSVVDSNVASTTANPDYSRADDNDETKTSSDIEENSAASNGHSKPENVISVKQEHHEKNQNEIDAKLDLLENCTEMGPAVVHCSAGIGRSGTFCLVDVVLKMLEDGIVKDDGDIDLQEILLELRRSRIGLIQTPDQLKFAYIVLIEAVRRRKAQKHASEMLDSSTEITNVQEVSAENIFQKTLGSSKELMDVQNESVARSANDAKTLRATSRSTSSCNNGDLSKSATTVSCENTSMCKVSLNISQDEVIRDVKSPCLESVGASRNSFSKTVEDDRCSQGNSTRLTDRVADAQTMTTGNNVSIYIDEQLQTDPPQSEDVSQRRSQKRREQDYDNKGDDCAGSSGRKVEGQTVTSDGPSAGARKTANYCFEGDEDDEDSGDEVSSPSKRTRNRLHAAVSELRWEEPTLKRTKSQDE